MNLVIAMAIGGLFGVSFGWCWGYHARPEPRRVWACARCDEQALTADEQARFKAITRYFDQTPIPDTLCCLRWWESAGAEHDPAHCTRKGHHA